MALQHLRSSTADKRPTPAAMSDGQLALNTNLASPGLFFKDSNGDSVKIGPVHIGTTAPNATPGAGGQAGNSKGEAWLDTTAANPILKVFNGSAFVAVQPVGTGTVVSTTDTGTVTSTMILDGTILNADINASAAIVDTKLATIATGGKVSGTAITSGNISTSGSFTSTSTVTGTNLIPTGSGVPTNGIYLPAANSVAVATNGTSRLSIDASGSISINATGPKNPDGYNTTNFKFLTLQATTGGTDRGALLELVGTGGGSPGYWLGRIGFFSTGNSYPHTSIFAATDSGGSNGAALIFNTTTTANVSFPIERGRFRSDGTFEIKGAGTGGSSPGFSVNPSTPANSFVIDSSGRLGIGTSAPSANLESQGNVSSTTQFSGFQGLRIQNANGSAFGVSADINFVAGTSTDNRGAVIGAVYESPSGGNGLYFATNGSSVTASDTPTERMRIDSQGRLGIGVTGPRASLEISDGSTNTAGEAVNELYVVGATTIGSEGIVTIQSNDSLAADKGGSIAFGGRAVSASTAGANWAIINGFKENASSANYAGYLSFNTRASGGAFSERARLDSSGRLLVGTSSGGSVARLQVQGSTIFNDAFADLCYNGSAASGIAANTTLGVFRFTDQASNSNIFAQISCATDAIASSGDYPGRLVFSTTADSASSPTERMRITQSGMTKISNNGGSGATRYSNTSNHVIHQSVTSQWALAVEQSASSTPYGIVIEYPNVTPNNTDSPFLHCTDSSALRASIRSNGGLANYSGNNVNLSDINTKKDISPAAGTWDCIKEWEIVNYRYKDQPDDTDLNMGVIAQQVAESCPEVITVFEEAKDDQPEKLGVKEQQMYWMAIKALQEAQVRIEQLEAKVVALESA
jgi:hypothetical protein